MKKLYILFPAIIFSIFSQAQSHSPSALSSTGGFVSNGNGSVSYTVGEMTMVRTFSANGNILTQGFQQPADYRIGALKMSGLKNVAPGDFGSFIVYPNPAIDDVWFGLQLSEPGKVEVKLYDALGQMIAQVFNANYENEKVVEHIDITMYPAGIYLLSMSFVSDKDGKKHTSSTKFQVVK